MFVRERISFSMSILRGSERQGEREREKGNKGRGWEGRGVSERRIGRERRLFLPLV